MVDMFFTLLFSDILFIFVLLISFIYYLQLLFLSAVYDSFPDYR